MEDLTVLNPEQLMAQALNRADKFLVEASRRVDNIYGRGFSRENSDTVNALVQASAINFAASLIAREIALLRSAERPKSQGG